MPRTKDWANTREELVGWGPAHPLLEAGDRAEGKGANSAPETASSTKWQTGFQLLTKDFLRFWMVDICREGHSQKSASQKGHKAYPTGTPRNWGWDPGTTEEGRRSAPRKSVLIKLLAVWAALAGEGTKHRPNQVCVFVEYPKTWIWVA